MYFAHPGAGAIFIAPLLGSADHWAIYNHNRLDEIAHEYRIRSPLRPAFFEEQLAGRLFPSRRPPWPGENAARRNCPVGNDSPQAPEGDLGDS